MITKIDAAGNIIWSNNYPFYISNVSYNDDGNTSGDNIYLTTDHIYFAVRIASYDVVGKIEQNAGNLIRSKHFVSNNPILSNNLSKGIFEKNGMVFFFSDKHKQDPITLNHNYQGLIITKLSALDGSLINSTLLSIVSDNYAKGINTRAVFSNGKPSFNVTGQICVSLPNGGINSGMPNSRFNIEIDTGINLIRAYYYKTSIPFTGAEYRINMNSYAQIGYLYAAANSTKKYFILYDSLQSFIKCRKFTVPTNSVSGTEDIIIDNKQNIHFLYNYSENNTSVSEYARISDLAPANTLGCFGEDTASIFQQFPMQVTKEPFTWDVVQDNVLSSMPVTIYTENFPIQKEVVCKQVSYCDSVKILGNPVACITGGDARFSSFLNPQCLKNLNWSFDTTYASVVNYEADSALTLRLKQSGQFYLKAEVNNCVVKDSVLVTITQPQTALQWNKQDSLLCPSGTVTLQVNAGFRSYQWQDGSTNNTYLVTNPGLYRITATDSCGNIFTDSVNITVADTSLAVAATYSICTYDSARILFPPGVYNINWQPATAGLLQGNTLTLFPQQTTGYLLQAQKPPGCLIQKNITVIKEDCPEWVRFPSAFTPNNDGLNDFLNPASAGSYNLTTLRFLNATAN